MYVLPFRVERCDIQSEAKLAANISSNLECFWFFKCINGFIIEKVTFKSYICTLLVNCASINEDRCFTKYGQCLITSPLCDWLSSSEYILLIFVSSSYRGSIRCTIVYWCTYAPTRSHPTDPI